MATTTTPTSSNSNSNPSTSISLHLSDRFILSQRTYTQQYANLYFARLNQLRPSLEKAAQLKWKSLLDQGSIQYVPKIVDIQPGVPCFIIGTVHRELPYKPNILQDIANEYSSNPLPPPKHEKYYGEKKDTIALEDEHGRTLLQGSILEKETMVTGTVLAFLGSEGPSGAFEVIDLCYPQNLLFEPKLSSIALSSCWIGLASGLGLGDQQETHGKEHPVEEEVDLLSVQLLFDYLSGHLGSDKSPATLPFPELSHFFFVGHNASTLNSLRTLDTYFHQLLPNLSIVLVPGFNDITTQVLPQQPWHRSLFQRTSHFDQFHVSTNPMVADLAGFTIVASGGQTLDDVYKYLPDENRLEMATRFLKWRHLAPTAPDTLWCYPYLQKDPFVLDKKPRLFVIGNQPKFETCIYKDDSNPTEEIRVLLLPKFKSSSLFVLVDLVSLEYRVFQIQHPTSSSSSHSTTPSNGNASSFSTEQV